MLDGIITMGPNNNSLPLYKSRSLGYDKDTVKIHSNPYGRRASIYLQILARYIRTIIQDPKTRKVFVFLCLNLSFTGVEAVYGILTNSLSLTSDALHMFFDSSAIILGLFATVVAKWDADEKFTYGYGRVEILAGFANAFALFLASFGIIWEAIERMYDPPKVDTNRLYLVSFLGLLVNLVGIFAFEHHHHHGHSHGHDHGHGHGHSHGGYAPAPTSDPHDHQHHHQHGEKCNHDHHDHGHNHHGHSHSHSSHSHSHDDHHHHGHNHSHHNHDHGSNALMHGMFLHVLADTLGSVGVIVSSILIDKFGWTWADPVTSIFLALLILGSVWPLLKSSSMTLLQRIPEGLEHAASNAYRQVAMLEGVVSFSAAHFWELSSNHWVGSIKIHAKGQVNEQTIRLQVSNVFKDVGVKNMTVQVEKDVVAGF